MKKTKIAFWTFDSFTQCLKVLGENDDFFNNNYTIVEKADEADVIVSNKLSDLEISMLRNIKLFIFIPEDTYFDELPENVICFKAPFDVNLFFQTLKDFKNQKSEETLSLKNSLDMVDKGINRFRSEEINKKLANELLQALIKLRDKIIDVSTASDIEEIMIEMGDIANVGYASEATRKKILEIYSRI